ncbi:hypothetical protein [Streptomyces zhihengii]|uniref:hypothetical protein n=1 Tax=Streptomyces zhihengii TaxID=1818004 RepID=UPI0033BA4CCF
MLNGNDESQGPSVTDSRKEFYADLVELGGLAAAIQTVARRRSCATGFDEEFFSVSGDAFSAATFPSPRGDMRVNLGLGVRRFAVTFDSDQEHVWASGSTESLSELVGVMGSWINGIRLPELHQQFPFMEYTRLALAYEEGNPAQVQWDILIESEIYAPYRAMLAALRGSDEISRLFPYFSHWTLRLKGNGADSDMPEICVQSAGDGGFSVWLSGNHETRQECADLEGLTPAVTALLRDL